MFLDIVMLDITSHVRPYCYAAPYVEAFAGYSKTSIDITATVAPNSRASATEDDSGLFLGLGGGIGFAMSETTLLTIGAEFTRSNLDSLDSHADVLEAVIGARVQF